MGNLPLYSLRVCNNYAMSAAYNTIFYQTGNVSQYETTARNTHRLLKQVYLMRHSLR